MEKRVIDYQTSEQDRFSLFEMSCFLEEKINIQSELYIKTEDVDKKAEIYEDLSFFLKIYNMTRQAGSTRIIRYLCYQMYQQLQLLDNNKPKIKDNIEFLLRACEEIIKDNGSNIVETTEIINTYNQNDRLFIFGLSWVAGIITAIVILIIKLNFQ